MRSDATATIFLVPPRVRSGASGLLLRLPVLLLLLALRVQPLVAEASADLVEAPLDLLPQVSECDRIAAAYVRQLLHVIRQAPLPPADGEESDVDAALRHPALAGHGEHVLVGEEVGWIELESRRLVGHAVVVPPPSGGVARYEDGGGRGGGRGKDSPPRARASATLGERGARLGGRAPPPRYRAALQSLWSRRASARPGSPGGGGRSWRR